jgi:hypothetical protein
MRTKQTGGGTSCGFWSVSECHYVITDGIVHGNIPIFGEQPQTKSA